MQVAFNFPTLELMNQDKLEQGASDMMREIWLLKEEEQQTPNLLHIFLKIMRVKVERIICSGYSVRVHPSRHSCQLTEQIILYGHWSTLKPLH